MPWWGWLLSWRGAGWPDFGAVAGVVAGAGEQGGDDAGGGVGDGGAEGGLPHRRVPDDLDVEDVEQFGLQVRGQGGEVGGDFGQQADQVGGGGRGVVGGQFGELGFDGFAFVVQGGVVGADAAAVLLAGFVGHVEGAVELAHQVVLLGGDALEPGAEGGGLAVVLLLAGGGGVRDELREALFPAGGQGVGGQAAEGFGFQEVFADLDGAGVVGGGGDVTGVPGLNWHT